jgi:aspartyl-tRNA(Asn)/glutamyl-tRNA(Gln) amidotransferase subunit A
MTLWSAGATHALRNIHAADQAKMDPGLVELAEDGARVTSAEYVDVLLYQRNSFAERMAAFHERYDLLLSPTMPLPAFEAGRLTPAHGRYGDIWTNWSPFTYPFNLSQQPAVTVPMGLTRENLPAGLQIIGAFGADTLVLRAAAAFEAANLFPRLSAPRGSA